MQVIERFHEKLKSRPYLVKFIDRTGKLLDVFTIGNLDDISNNICL